MVEIFLRWKPKQSLSIVCSVSCVKLSKVLMLLLLWLSRIIYSQRNTTLIETNRDIPHLRSIQMWTTCKKTRQSLGKQKKHWVKEEERMKFFYTIVNLSNIKLGLTKTNASEIISKIISKFTIKRFLSAKLRKKKRIFLPARFQQFCAKEPN